VPAVPASRVAYWKEREVRWQAFVAQHGPDHLAFSKAEAPFVKAAKAAEKAAKKKPRSVAPNSCPGGEEPKMVFGKMRCTQKEDVMGIDPVDLENFRRLTTRDASRPPVLHMEGRPSDHEDVADLMIEVERWLKKERVVAEGFVKRATEVAASRPAEVRAFTGVGQFLEVLKHLSGLLDDVRDTAREVRLAQVHSVQAEAKNSSDAVSSLARWLKGATPAVGSYAKKIGTGTVDGKTLSRKEQEALTLVVASLGSMRSAIDALNANVPLLLRDHER
jgi:hypothetical protein